MPESWTVLPLRDLVDRRTERSAGASDVALTVSAEFGLVEQEAFFTKRIASKDLSSYWVVHPGDYVFNKSSSIAAPLGTVARNRSGRIGVVSPLYLVMRPAHSGLEAGWLDLAFESSAYRESLQGLLKEGARSHGALNVKVDDYLSALLPIPPMSEQRRILDLVAATDRQATSLKSTLDEARRTLVQARENYFRSSEWAQKPLSEVLEDSRKPIQVSPEGSYSQLGVRSHGRGVFAKEATLGANLGGKKMFELSAGDLVLNIVFAWERAVALVPAEFHGWCASHRFPTYRGKSAASLDYVRHFLLSDQGAAALLLASPGGAGRNRTLNRQKFGEIRLPWAPEKEQMALTEALSGLELAILTTEREYAALRRIRTLLVRGLVDGTLRIPSSYDALLGAEA